MDTNKEAVFSLVRLLVRKAGFDLDKNLAEEELAKTKANLEKLYKEKETLGSNKNLDQMIENVKKRQAFWENNAEVVGKSLLEAFEEGKTYNSVKLRVEHLVNLAGKGTKDLQVSYIYSRSSELEEEYKELAKKINTSDYINLEEKEMDSKYQVYLENKIASINDELSEITKELESLREVETKDVVIVNKIKVYNDSLEKNFKKLEQARSETINTDITFEVWEKLEGARNDIESKLEKSKEALERTESMLEDVRKNRTSLTSRKSELDNELTRCTAKLENVSAKLKEDDYVNKAEKMMDLSRSEMIRLEAEALRNKKDFIYVDALKVKEELAKEWDSAIKSYKEKLKQEKLLEKEKEKTLKKELNKQKEEIKEEANKVPKEEIKDDTPVTPEFVEKATEAEEKKEVETEELTKTIDEALKEMEDTSKSVDEIIEKVNDDNKVEEIVETTENENKEEKNKYELEW